VALLYLREDVQGMNDTPHNSVSLSQTLQPWYIGIFLSLAGKPDSIFAPEGQPDNALAKDRHQNSLA
jgi:hypothetical protein